MRRHKALARIFLFLSIVNFTFAGIVQTPAMDEMPVNLAENVTEASERGYTQWEELAEWLEKPPTTGHLHSRIDIIPAQSFNYGETGNPEDDKFFNEALKRKMKEYLILGTIAGLFTGVANGMQKEITGTVTPGAQTVGRSVEPLNEHPQDQEDLVPRSLSDLRDEDLKLLSIISGRMLNSLD